MNNLHYKKKYLKYKSKYLKLKGGMDSEDEDKCDCVCPLEKKKIKCEAREYITVTITQLNGEEFHLTIPENSTTEELYNRIEIELRCAVDLYIHEVPVCHNGTLDDNGIIHGSQLSCIIKETNYLIDAEKLQNLQQLYGDDIKLIFWPAVLCHRDGNKTIIKISIELYESSQDYFVWTDAFSSSKPKELSPMIVLLDILQKYFIYKDNYPIDSEGLFHTTSIINDKIILEAIETHLHDYIKPRAFYNLISEEDMEYMRSREFINEFYNMFCQPYREAISQKDITSFIMYTKEYPTTTILYEDEESEDDY